jgi:hypothetical protein
MPGHESRQNSPGCAATSTEIDGDLNRWNLRIGSQNPGAPFMHMKPVMMAALALIRTVAVRIANPLLMGFEIRDLFGDQRTAFLTGRTAAFQAWCGRRRRRTLVLGDYLEWFHSPELP